MHSQCFERFNNEIVENSGPKIIENTIKFNKTTPLPPPPRKVGETKRRRYYCERDSPIAAILLGEVGT